MSLTPELRRLIELMARIAYRRLREREAAARKPPSGANPAKPGERITGAGP